MPPPTLPTAELLAESAWLRRLARRLVRDEARAEDLVQDTLLAALERERAGRVPGRAWLAAVLLNVVRFDARSGARRAAREAGAAAPDAPPADELVARLEAHRLLVEAVLALEEPYRSTLALRFLEGLPPRAVARRMGVPVKTVHTRTDRALARLKERLDRSFGRRDAWCAALGELARGGLALPLGLGTLGGAAMGAAIKWGSAAAVLVAGGFLDPEGLAGSTDGPNEVVAVSAGFLPARRSLEGLSNEERQKLVLVLDGASSSIAGSVLDAAGEPVPEAFVWSLDSTPFGFVLERLSNADTFFALPVSQETLAAGETYTQGSSHAADAAGRFELRGLLPQAYRLCALDPATLAVAGPVAVDAGERNARLRLRADERAGPVAGRVTNLAGEPVEGVAVAAYRRVEDAAGAPSDPPYDHAVRTQTAADGTFRFERLVLEHTHLDLRTSDGAVVHVELEREAHPEALLLCVPEVRHVRVLLQSEPGHAAYFAFEDAAGKTLMASAMAGTVRASSDMHAFEDGSSGLVATDERARFLVLFKDGEEVRRVPLSLQRGEVNELRL